MYKLSALIIIFLFLVKCDSRHTNINVNHAGTLQHEYVMLSCERYIKALLYVFVFQKQLNLVRKIFVKEIERVIIA